MRSQFKQNNSIQVYNSKKENIKVKYHAAESEEKNRWEVHHLVGFDSKNRLKNHRKLSFFYTEKKTILLMVESSKRSPHLVIYFSFKKNQNDSYSLCKFPESEH